MNNLFWLTFTGITCGLALSAGIVLIVLRNYSLYFLPRNIPKILKTVNLLKKITWQGYFETNMRAQTGKTLDRPYGAKGAVFSWSKILFNPVYLSRSP